MANTSSAAVADEHGRHIWWIEPRTTHGVLTREGVNNIVHHKYKSGVYTYLDNILNSYWQYLTDLLPLWLAPNAVTAIGSSFSLFSYMVTAHVCYDFRGGYPGWLLILNGACLVIYFTLDCMDGKQARRTQSSSPMGQLFDHGLDCVGNISVISLIQGIFSVPASRPFMIVQGVTQLGFFQAQLEEYYTGTLTHATGDLGITEVIHSLALLSILRGLGLLGDEAFYSQALPDWTSCDGGLCSYLPGARFILEREGDDKPTVQLNEAFVLFWAYGFISLLIPSLWRISDHILTKTPSDAAFSKQHLMFSSWTKLVSPALLFFLSLYVKPLDASLGGIRYPSLVFGFAYCLMTIKVIVYSMAHMAYATFQWVDLLPLMILVGLDVTVGRDRVPEIQKLYLLLTLLSIVRLLWWTKEAVNVLCQALKIQLFRIPYSKEN